MSRLRRAQSNRRFPHLDLSKVRTYPLKKRRSKVGLKHLGQPHRPGSGFREFALSLPDVLGAKALREVAAAVVRAVRRKRVVALGMGGHPIKVGLSPVLVDLMERGVLSAMATNGSCMVHDLEFALVGRTSEDVDAALETGEFGMAEETVRLLNAAITDGVAKGMGLGEAVGRQILEGRFPHRDKSLFATAVRLGIPATVHVAVGTDIHHMHPSLDAAALGQGSHRDFLTFAGVVARLEGGVYINLGSAVLLPEVFLKAVTLARNLGHRLERFTTVNMDFLQHYRPLTNVVRRPTQNGGKGYALTGHHEILLPLLAALVVEGLEKGTRKAHSARRKG